MKIDIEKFKDLKVLVIGDLMIDEYVWGDVHRISPEAPVPIVSVDNTSFTLGGAGNVVNNIVSMGGKVSVAGTVGSGFTGKMLIDKLKHFNVDIKGLIEDPERPTTRKTRIIASNQQILRIDNETTREIRHHTFDSLKKVLMEKIPGMNLIIVSDYAKGLITEKLMKLIIDRASYHNILTIADPKGLDFIKYKNASILTPNRKEAALASNIEIKCSDDLIKAGRKIADQLNLDRLVITCGKDGMVLFKKDKNVVNIKSKARQVFDVSGAGDTVIAILGLAMASGHGFHQSASIANAAAGIVVGKVGTAAITPEELKGAIDIT